MENTFLITLPKSVYDELVETKRKFDTMSDDDTCKHLLLENEELKQKLKEEKRIRKNWAKCFNRQMKSENRELVNEIYNTLLEQCNMLGFLNKTKLASELNSPSSKIKKYIENKKTFFDWCVESEKYCNK